MNEQQWLSSDNPQEMLRWLTSRETTADANDPRAGRMLATDRRLRLFACAACRQVWDRLTDPRSRNAVEVAERYADGQADEYTDLLTAVHKAYAAWTAHHGRLNGDLYFLPWAACGESIADSIGNNWRLVTAQYGPSWALQATLLRDIFGNPWRPIFHPSQRPTVFGIATETPTVHFGNEQVPAVWLDEKLLTPNVLAVATAIYTERRWDEMPVLGDALEEAGCTDEVILSHCRGRETVPGCWEVRPSVEAGATIGYQVRWSLPDAEGRYLWVGHYYAGPDTPLSWCEHAAGRDAASKNAYGKLPTELRTGTGVPLTSTIPLRCQHVRGCWVVDAILGKP